MSTERLGWVYRLLVPGGLVVGHFEYGLSLRRLTAAGALVRLVRSTSRLGIVASVPYCKRALRRAGFIDLTCYYVHPHIDSPMGLIPSERRAARAHFVRMTRAQRGGHGLLMQGLRLGLAQVGLGGTMQPQLFVWASKPC